MFSRNSVQDVREQFVELYQNKDFVIDKSGVKTLEIVNANFLADEQYIFGLPDEDYIKRELMWYTSESLNINTIPGGPPKIWCDVADNNGNINSNYGWCIYSAHNYKQMNHVYNELKKNPNSRRAIMIYNRPSMWEDYNKNGMSDFMCTNAVQYLIRDNRLHAIVQMRSNDVVYGYRNDYAWQQCVLETLAMMLGCEFGVIHWNAGSLHLYERDFFRVEAWIDFNDPCMTKKEFNSRMEKLN